MYACMYVCMLQQVCGRGLCFHSSSSTDGRDISGKRSAQCNHSNILIQELLQRIYKGSLKRSIRAQAIQAYGLMWGPRSLPIYYNMPQNPILIIKAPYFPEGLRLTLCCLSPYSEVHGQLCVEFSVPSLIWEFPKIGDSIIVPHTVGSLLQGPQNKVPLIVGNSHICYDYSYPTGPTSDPTCYCP